MIVARVDRARRAVYAVFVVNGLLFASLVSRIPDVRSELRLDNGSLGLLLLALAVGSLVALPTSGSLVRRHGAGTVVAGGSLLGGAGLLVAAVGATVVDSVPVAALGLVAAGGGVGLWDVAMNVEAAEVERHTGRTIMPRFHAVFSLGAALGAVGAVGIIELGVPTVWHLAATAALAVPAVFVATRTFLPVVGEDATDGDGRPAGRGPSALAAWREPRTLLIGVVVLAFALAEGSANDWLALALVDGHGASPSVGVAGFALFVGAMTIGRLAGTTALDRWGRAPMLWSGGVLAMGGLVLLVHGSSPVLLGLGILCWGLGSSLGFPVGMSAAADDPVGAAARVSVVSTIGYAAFLAGPPLLGAVGDRVGTLESLQVVVVLMVPAMLAVVAVRPRPAESASASVEEGADVGGGDRR